MSDNEQIVHKLISDLIVMGSDDETAYANGLHQKTNILKHEELINAVMVQIKPGFCAHFLLKYRRQMLSKYLHKLKYRQYEE